MFNLKAKELLNKGIFQLCIVIAAITMFYILAFRGIIFQPEHVYQNWDNGIPPFSIQLQNLAKISKSTWWSTMDMGTPGVWSGTTRYFDIIFLNGLSFLGGVFLSKWLYLCYFIVGGLGFWFIGKRLGWGLCTNLAVVLISQFNPKTYSLIVSGHFPQQGFAYSLMPWLILIFSEVLNTTSKWLFCVYALAVGLLSVFIVSASPVAIVLWGVILALSFLVFIFDKKWRKIIIVFTMVSFIVILLHIYWIIPVKVISQEVEASFKFSETAERIMPGYISLYHSVSPHLWNALIGNTDVNSMAHEYVYPVTGVMGWIWKLAAYLLLLVVISGLFFRSERKNWKLFSILCLVTGIVLFAGDKTFMGRLFYETILFKIKIVFFLMARTSRWLLIYYTGFSLLLGFGLNSLIRFRDKLKKPLHLRVSRASLVFVFLIYWFPFWTGSITRPKNQTSQTLSLMPQKVSNEEKEVTERLAFDKEDYRITILPTIAGPTGDIPNPPKSTYTRNYLLFGKDAFGPGIISGEPFCRFILNLMFREDPYTDQLGKLLGMGAVKRIIKVKDEKYYTYFDFGYMKHPKNCGETLFEPERVLEKFLAAQKDCVAESGKIWQFKGINVYRNENFLPRIRVVKNAYLATGGMPLFVSLAQMPLNIFNTDAMFFGTDLDEASFERLKPYWKGIIINNNSWPELLLPFLPKNYWHFAYAPANNISKGWITLGEFWHSALWLDGSVLNSGALLSREKAEIVFPLQDNGTYRFFVCYGRVPNGGNINFILNGKNLASITDIENNQRGFIWEDLGNINLSSTNNTFKVEANDKGVAIRGILLMPIDIFDNAMQKLKENLLRQGNIILVAEAEAVSEIGASVSGNKIFVPLIHGNNNQVKAALIKAKNISDGTEDGRQIVTDTEEAGEAVFEVTFTEKVSKCKLECYPRFNNDKEGKGFIAAYYSYDGKDYQPLFRLEGNKSGRMDDIYAKTEEHTFNCDGQKIFIKFELKSAQLCSLLRGAYTPMRLIGEVKEFEGVVKSWGQAVRLPSTFNFYIPKEGQYQIMARMLGKQGEKIEINVLGNKKTFELGADGESWLDAGNVKVETAGPLKIELSGAQEAFCDLFVLESISEKDTDEPGTLLYNRINPATYSFNLKQNSSGLLLFSEAFHPKWFLKVDNRVIEPIKAFGFINAYPVPSGTKQKAELYFKYQAIRDYYWKISRIGWFVVGVIFLICIIRWLYEKKRTL